MKNTQYYCKGIIGYLRVIYAVPYEIVHSVIQHMKIAMVFLFILFINLKHFCLMKTFNEIVNDIKNLEGSVVINSTLERVAISEGNGGYAKATLEIAEPKLNRVVVDAEGNEKVEQINFCNMSEIGFIASLRESKLKPVIKSIRRNYDLLDIYLDAAKVELVQIKVPAKTDHVNPFSENAAPVKFDTTKYITFLTKVTLSAEATEDLRTAKKYMLMGIRD